MALQNMRRGGGARRARCAIEDDSVEQERVDPVAAATAAKAERHAASLKAAVLAAARAADASITTVFFDTPEKASTDEVRQSAEAAPALHPEGGSPRSDRETDHNNGLASLLGYSHDTSSDDEGSQDGSVPSTSAELALIAATGPSAVNLQQSNPMDTVMASFMEELESSGLLKDDALPEVPLTASAPTAEYGPALAPAPHSPEAASAVMEDAPTAAEAITAGLPLAAAAASSAMRDSRVSSESGKAGAAEEPAAAGGDAERGGEWQGADSAGEEGEQETAAEQRVLGDLEGAPGWAEVMDMGSRKVYYWCADTDEVLWEPPSGGARSTDDERAIAVGDLRAPAQPETQPQDPAEASAQQQTQLPIMAAAVAAAATSCGGKREGIKDEAEEADNVAAPCAGDVYDHDSRCLHVLDALKPGVVEAGTPGEAQQLATQLTQVLRGAAGSIFSGASKLMWLAVEAEVRARDLSALGAAHVAAASAPASAAAPTADVSSKPRSTMDSSVAVTLDGVADAVMEQAEDSRGIGTTEAAAAAAEGAAPAIRPFDWAAYEAYTLSQLKSIEAELPAALEEAAALSASLTAPAAQPQSQTQLDAPSQADAHPVASAAAQTLPTGAILATASAEGEVVSNESRSMMEDTGMEEGELSESIVPPGDAVGAPAIAAKSAAGVYRGEPTAGPQPSVAPSAAAAAAAAEIPPPPPVDAFAAAIAALPPAMAFGAGRPARLALPYDPTVIAHLQNPHWLPMPYPPFVPPYAVYPPMLSYPLHHYPGYPPMGAYEAPPTSGVAAPTPPADEALPPLPEDDSAPPLPPSPTAAVADELPPLPDEHSGLATEIAQPVHPPALSVPLPAAEAASPPAAVTEPSSLPAAEAATAAVAAAARLEYRAEPVLAPRELSPDVGELYEQMQRADGSYAPVLADAGGAADRKRRAEKAPVGAGLLTKKKKTGKAGKHASSLIDKWQAVRKDLDEKEEAEAARAFRVDDAEAAVARRAAEAEEWRLQQLRTGQSDENPNMQPLAGSWQERVKAAKKVEKRAAKKAAKAAAGGAPQAVALSEGLPPGWQAMVDSSSGDVYYGNLETKETSWDRPV